MKKFSIIMLFMLLSITAFATTVKTDVVVDTVRCNYECIDKIVSEQTKSGKIKYFAVYNDTKNDISELIPVSEQVLMYIKTCKDNKIKPSLAIKLRNGVISGLIRYKMRYGVKKGKKG
jgi:hypothetical protein